MEECDGVDPFRMIDRNPFRDTYAFILSLEHDNVASRRHMIRAYINRPRIRPKS